MKSRLYQLTDAQHATVLAALRFYQGYCLGNTRNHYGEVNNIATNCGTVTALDAAGVDALCESINHHGLTAAQCFSVLGADDLLQALQELIESEDGSGSDRPHFLRARAVLASATEPQLSDDDDEEKCTACGAPDNDGEGWNGLCSNCADLVGDDSDDEVRAWAKLRGIDFDDQSDDGQQDLRIDYIRDQKGITA